MSDNLLAIARWSSLLVLSIAIGLVTYQVAVQKPTVSAGLGRRGLRRRQALAQSQWFRFLDPALGFFAGWVAFIPGWRWRERLDTLLSEAGDWLGLSADELLGVCAMGAAGSAMLGLWFARQMGLGPMVALPLAMFGGSWPYFHVRAVREERLVSVERSLPATMDIVILCMDAGLDFVGAIRRIVRLAEGAKDPLLDELGIILRELELGYARERVLLGFAERTPAQSVRQFVSAVVQAERKGNPLATVLRTQAGMLRMQRSFLAEEAVAKASVAMSFPVGIATFACIVLFIAPFMLTNFGLSF